MALFDAFSTRSNTQNTSTTNIADSYNQSFSSTNVVSDQGNLSLNLGTPANPSTDPLARLLPVVGLGVVVIGLVAYFNRRA